MRKMLCFCVVAVMCTASFGTDSRIISMGRHDNFFMDDFSVFRNPANLNMYPNLMMGSLGEYRDTSTTSTQTEALERENRDPVHPYVGGIVSYSFNKTSEGGSQYPMLSLGLAVNRQDKMLDYVTEENSVFKNAFRNDTATMFLDPVGKFDVMAGYAFPNGMMVGLGTYVAFQKQYRGTVEEKTSLFKLNAGVNSPIARSVNLEVSANLSVLNAAGSIPGTLDTRVLAKNDISVEADGRLFIALPTINGDFVPRVGFDYINFDQASAYTLFSVSPGIGMNLNIDKGFAWGGIEFLYENEERPDTVSYGYGGQIGFGLERNIVWDWFVLRGGFKKTILYRTNAENTDRGTWVQNPEADASDDDFVGFGIGANIENRLKIDCVVAEDVPYTFTNLFSGPHHHLFPRFTITYSF